MIGQQTVKALVISYDKERGSYIALCNSITKDVIINNRFVPTDINMVGRWITVVVSGETACDYVDIIDDVFETRIMNGLVEVKTEATLVDYGTRMYHQTSNALSFFGFIFDCDNRMDDERSQSVYYIWVTPWKTKNARWKISRKQEMSIFGEDGIHRTLEGIIHHDRTNSDQYIAWSKSNRDNDIFLDYFHCPGRNSMLGTWVRMTIDENNCVVNNVHQIDDLYRTRTREKIVEVFIDFKCIPKVSEVIFYHSYFGYICDPKKVFRGNPNIGARYSGWIAINQSPEARERWRLADNQNIEQLLSQINNEYCTRSIEEEPGQQLKSNWEYNTRTEYSRYHETENNTHDPDNRRMEYKSWNPRSQALLSKAENSDSELTDSDEEFYGLAPYVSNKPMNKSNQNMESSSTQRTMHLDHHYDVPEQQRSAHLKPVHTQVYRSSEITDKHSKRPKKQRTIEELEFLKLRSELVNMQRSISILIRHQTVVDMCKKADRESFDAIMALMNSKH